MSGIPLLFVIFIVAIYLISSIKILAEYERGVIFRLGRLLPQAKGPGVILVFAPIDRMVRISLRVDTIEVPPQDVITRDNVTVKVNAVIYFRVVEPRLAVTEVSNFLYASSQLAQTTLRSVLGEVELDDLLSKRDELNVRLQSILDEHTSPWGVKITLVSVKQVDLPEQMIRAIGRQAEAEREKRAKIIHAEGEYTASEKLAMAAEVIQKQPAAIQLRYLQTLVEIGTEKNTTIVFPMPIDILSSLDKFLGAAARRDRGGKIEIMTQTDGEKELVLGNKQLISLFFVVVALCGVFFAMGYMIGRNTSKPATANLESGNQAAAAAPAAAPNGESPAPQPQDAEPPRETAPSETQPAGDAPTPVSPPTHSLPPSTQTQAAHDTPSVSRKTGATYLQVTALRRADADNLVKTLREQKLPRVAGRQFEARSLPRSGWPLSPDRGCRRRESAPEGAWIRQRLRSEIERNFHREIRSALRSLAFAFRRHRGRPQDPFNGSRQGPEDRDSGARLDLRRNDMD